MFGDKDRILQAKKQVLELLRTIKEDLVTEKISGDRECMMLEKISSIP